MTCGATECAAKFAPDGHRRCLLHRPCAPGNIVFDPQKCSVCYENVKVLLRAGFLDRNSSQYNHLSQAWELVLSHATSSGLRAYWADQKLQRILRFETSGCQSSSSRSRSHDISQPSQSSVIKTRRTTEFPPPTASQHQPAHPVTEELFPAQVYLLST